MIGRTILARLPRRLGVLAVAGAMSVGIGAAAHAETMIKFATALSNDSGLMRIAYAPWLEELNAKAEGEFKIQAFPPPFATATNVWDRVVDGVADMGIIVLPATGLPFAGSHVSTVPGAGDNVKAGAVALWELYEKGLLEGEFDDVHLVNLVTVPANVFISKEKVDSMDDIAGMKVRANDKNSAAALSNLGASPIAIPFSEAYQALSKGVVQGGVANGVTIVGFKFGEVTGWQIDNVFFGMVPAAIVMNKEFYEGLSPKAKEILASVHGREGSLDIGRRQHQYDLENRAYLEADENYTFVTLSDAEKAKWDAELAKVGAVWAADTPNGEEILRVYTEEYQKAASQY
ncbi:MAG: TRAP transporter substrate-binding protein DctP [Sulfitobacter sp.]